MFAFDCRERDEEPNFRCWDCEKNIGRGGYCAECAAAREEGGEA